MEARIAKLEEFAAVTNERLARIEARLDQMATKADLAEKVGELKAEIQRSANEMIRWIVGTAIVITVGAVTVMTFVLNHGTPKVPPSAPPAPPAPIVIYAQPTAAPK